MLTNKQEMILSEIRQNSRQHISEIARKLNMPLSTVHDNCRILSQYIKQYATLFDFAKMGYSLRVNFMFRIKNRKVLDDFLLKSRNVNSICRINNRSTLLVECFFRSMSEAYEFKEKLQDEGIGKIDMRYIIEEIKKEGFLPGNLQKQKSL
jgi:DNA-binding Lrp family transcriptional regulator